MTVVRGSVVAVAARLQTMNATMQAGSAEAATESRSATA